MTGRGAWLGVVLAGGESSRFGRDKSQVEVAGEPMLERVRSVLAQVLEATVVIGGQASEVREPEPGAGPLQALIAGLEEAERRGLDGIVALACDLPAIDVATVRRLAEPLPDGMVARVPRLDGWLQVLAATYAIGVLDPLRAARASGRASLTAACERLGAALLAPEDFDPAALADADTPQALEGLVGRPVSPVRVWDSARGEPRRDLVATEEPLEIVVDGEALAVLLRTPSGREDDLSLAAGFLLSEGVIDRASDLDGLAPCRDPAAEHPENRVLVTLAPGVTVPDSARRLFVAGASCGLCGKTTIASLLRRLPERGWPPGLDGDAIGRMHAAVRRAQQGYRSTGALHAAALFDGASLVDVAEDVGRHNAVDKLFGRAVRTRSLPLAEKVLWVSGRISFELVQKALVAGVDGLVAVGAPTSMAVALAEEGRLHLVGFARDGRFNVYAGALA